MRKPALLQHLVSERHGDPETAGAAVKIVQVLTGPEVEPATNQMEWSTLDMQETENLVLNHPDAIQTIIIPDESGRPIEIQVISSENQATQADDQLQFDLSELDVIEPDTSTTCEDQLASLL